MEGAWFDDERVKRSKERIDKTDYFSEVTVETPPVPGTTDQVDVNIGVVEKTTGNISVGAGFSQSEGVILSGSISQANLFGSGKFVSLQVNTGDINRTLGIGYNNPYFTVDGVSQGFDAYHRKSTPESLGYYYSTESTGGGVRFGIPLDEKQSLNFGLAIDYTDVKIDPTSISQPPPTQYLRFNNQHCGTGTSDLTGIPNSAIPSSCDNFTVPATIGWVRDTKDSAINPTKGSLQKLNFEVAIPGGDLTYYKATYQYQQFFAVTRNVVMMLNGELGYGKGLSDQDLPFYKNFYAGGPGSVRGYDTASLGPYELDSSGDYVRLGGTTRAVFNAELSMPVPGLGMKEVKFGPFFDAGQVYSDASNMPGVYEGGAVRMSVGIAATWISPFGPLKFSLAQPLNDQESDKLQQFQFQMGQTF